MRKAGLDGTDGWPESPECDMLGSDVGREDVIYRHVGNTEASR